MHSFGRILRIVIACACGFCCASCGPHMNIQPSIQPYEREMPEMPAVTVPFTGRLETRTLEASQIVANPLSRTPENLEKGRIYYGYYCRMCHGKEGDGHGPVGQSYVPKPADLSSPALAGLTAGELYYRMLYGTGHEPVMDQTVLPEHRWPLVMYVRTFQKAEGR
ncbi:MAG: cytochrome C [Armatimonadetes bacterium]|nr:cytochrome C [Armatimonadota bacterium]